MLKTSWDRALREQNPPQKVLWSVVLSDQVLRLAIPEEHQSHLPTHQSHCLLQVICFPSAQVELGVPEHRIYSVVWFQEADSLLEING